MSDKPSHRYTKGDDYDDRRSKNPAVAKEVANLLKSGTADYTALSKLRSKYKDEDFVYAVFDAFKDKHEHLMRKARKVKEVVLRRYGITLSLKDLIKKVKKYAGKWKLNDTELDYVIHLIVTDKTYHPAYLLPNTEMSKALGYAAVLSTADKLRVKDNELPALKDILDLYGQTRTLHAQVVLQTLTYRDSAPEAITGNLNPDKHNWYSYVHPIIAALFFPKVKLLENHMLLANIGHIVKTKNDGRPIVTQPDWSLYWSLITDPNDLACTIESPIEDLQKRFYLQTKVWDSVLNLRQGKYYNDRLADFLSAIDNCRSSIYDAPDLTYVKDEGTILRRLLAAFSIRPTIVSTSRLWGTVGTGMGLARNPLTMAGITDLTSVPMIPLRLPLKITGQDQAVHLEEAISQAQWFVDKGTIVPKSQSIIHSREVLFFYVGRRFQTINISRLAAPYNFHQLPMTVSGWETLNDQLVNFDHTMTIMGDVYKLRSVVFVEVSKTKKTKLIIGCSAGIVVPSENDPMGMTTYLYNPQGAGEKWQFDSGTQYTRNAPLAEIASEAPLNARDESFGQRARSRGTIFMYKKEREGDHPFFNYARID